MSDDSQTADAATGESGQTVAADVVTDTGAPDECTLSPRNAPDDRDTTAWIIARGDAFSALDEMR